MTREIELLPCPFCGKETSIDSFKSLSFGMNYQIQCQNGNCAVEVSTCAYTCEETAIKAWNTRATEQSTDKADALELENALGIVDDLLQSGHLNQLDESGVWFIRERAALSQRPQIPQGWALVPFDKPVNSEMKAACIGEFSFTTEEPEIDEDGDVTGETYLRKNTVPWDTCKEIYKAMLKVAASQPPQEQP
jgi:hypothetical protein